MDFQDVVHWQNNKLDRTQSSRMGWTDLSICISGPVVQDLKEHFVQRWNVIYEEKYRVRKDTRYSLLSATGSNQPAPVNLAPPQPYGQPAQGVSMNLRCVKISAHNMHRHSNSMLHQHSRVVCSMPKVKAKVIAALVAVERVVSATA